LVVVVRKDGDPRDVAPMARPATGSVRQKDAVPVNAVRKVGGATGTARRHLVMAIGPNARVLHKRTSLELTSRDDRT